MFTAELFTVTDLLKYHKYPSKKMEFYSAIKKKKKNEILSFVITWVNLQGIMLSEMSDGKRQILYNSTGM